MKVVVTGATGFVGGHLVRALIARGDEVTAIARPSSQVAILRSLPLTIATCDPSDTTMLSEIVSGKAVVIHVAGAIKALNNDDLVAANVTATASLAMACSVASSRPDRFVLVSSQAARGPTTRTNESDVNAPPAPTSDYGKSKLGGEQAVAAHKGSFEIVVIRPSVVYGPGDRSLRSLFQLARLGIAPMLPNDPPISLIHVEDLVRCLILAATNPIPNENPSFAFTSPSMRLSDILLQIGIAYGLVPISIPVPACLMRAAGVLSDVVARTTGVPRPFGLDKANEMLRDSWALSTGPSERKLGFVGEIDHVAGLTSTAHWYRSQGWVRP